LSEYVPLDELHGTKVGEFICWPVYSEEDAAERLRQLKGLGVESLALGGRHDILGNMILGKGHVGVVIRATWRGLDVALKARRTDADRPTMMEEAELLRRANDAGVGPKLYTFSRDFMVMEMLSGPYLGDWVKGYEGAPEDFKHVLWSLLHQVRSLDKVGLDHGELTRVRRHFIVSSDGPRVIDFESASFSRRTQNVTATVQSMFLHKRFSRLLKDLIPLPDRGKLIEALTEYKQEQTDEKFKVILDVCGLTPITDPDSHPEGP
jgi:putative serine/threonine protein kinase